MTTADGLCWAKLFVRDVAHGVAQVELLLRADFEPLAPLDPELFAIEFLERSGKWRIKRKSDNWLCAIGLPSKQAALDLIARRGAPA